MSPGRNETIYAVSTGVGRAAIAIIRVSGVSARRALEVLAGSAPKPRHAALRKLQRPGDGAVLDEAVVLFFPGPRSETGEDIAEFQVHGGRAVVAAVLAALSILPGMRPAEPGEFARRALLNGKMDLVDVEALADLIDADTEEQRRHAIESGGSLLRGKAESWRGHLLNIRADIEAQIDFGDEDDVERHFDSSAERLLQELIAEMDDALASGIRGERVRDGYRVALLGAPNAGKSSLLNAITRRDVAIVSDIAGTTRDRLEVVLDLNGIPIVLVDTAGLRASEDSIEIEGMRRSRDAARTADLTLWLMAANGGSDLAADLGGATVRIVGTKSDLGPSATSGCWATVSIHDPSSIDDLLGKIEAQARAEMKLGEPSVVTRLRQSQAIFAARDELRNALEAGSVDVVAEHLRLAEVCLERLLGRIGVEDVLGAIFSRFCIGK